MESKGRIYDVTCGEPQIPSNGWIEASRYTYPNTVTFHCRKGFRLSGDHVIRCESNGYWSGPSPRCFAAAAIFPWWIILLCLVLFVPVIAYIITKCYVRFHRIQDEATREQAEMSERLAKRDREQQTGPLYGSNRQVKRSPDCLSTISES